MEMVDRQLFTNGGQRESFNLHAPGENMPGLKAGQASRTYFNRTTASRWVPGGRIRYTAQRGGSSSSSSGTMPGSALADTILHKVQQQLSARSSLFDSCEESQARCCPFLAIQLNIHPPS